MIAASVLKGLGITENPVSLLYHGIPQRHDGYVDGAVFEEHVLFLKRHFDIVRFSQDGDDSDGSRPRVAITFDDGYRNNAEIAAPILRRHRVPATFFVCSRHAHPGRYLWFSYLRALETHFTGKGFEFYGRYIDMGPRYRRDSVKHIREHLLSLRPHPAAMYREIEERLPEMEDFVGEEDLRFHYAGMTAEQIGELSEDPLFSVQAHTADHPFLTMCSDEDVLAQLTQNKLWIEGNTGAACSMVAYPSGEYDARTVQFCADLGFSHGAAVAPKGLGLPSFELSRLGIYSTSTNVLAIKAALGRYIRAFGVRVG